MPIRVRILGKFFSYCLRSLFRPNFHSPGLIPSENPRFSASFACADEIVVLNAQEFRR
jgi:hypothetical protein